jgi:hypothetical protein
METTEFDNGFAGDMDAMFNARDWLTKALEAAGAKVTDTGGGLGSADLWFTLDGCEFYIGLKAVLK